MYAFEDLDAVHAALNLLMRREPPLVKVLPRWSGTKESRFIHLLAGDAGPASTAEESTIPAHHAVSRSSESERIAELQSEIAELRRGLEALREQFATFQKQFQ
jgi:uncharacterized protein YceH (UPF0502 family)